MHGSSRALADRTRPKPNSFVTRATTAGGKLLPPQCGVSIRDVVGEVFGAVGVSGAGGTEAFGAQGVVQAGRIPDSAG
jgi:uncharacterized protein GlcG (DUF336 family)